MKKQGFALVSALFFLSLLIVLLPMTSWMPRFSIQKSAFTERYAKLDVARKVGLEEGKSWILRAAHRGYAPRAGYSPVLSKTPLEQIRARFADGSSAASIRLFGDIDVDIYVADLDYPPEIFGKKGSNLPRIPVVECLNGVERAYLVRSEASDKFKQSLCAEELVVVSFDLFGAVTGARKIFYRNR